MAHWLVTGASAVVIEHMNHWNPEAHMGVWKVYTRVCKDGGREPQAPIRLYLVAGLNLRRATSATNVWLCGTEAPEITPSVQSRFPFPPQGFVGL